MFFSRKELFSFFMELFVFPGKNYIAASCFFHGMCFFPGKNLLFFSWNVFFQERISCVFFSRQEVAVFFMECFFPGKN